MKKLLLLVIFTFSLFTISAQTWNALGVGVNGGFNNILSLGVYNGNLIAGGSFDSAGGYPAGLIAQWNGIKWDSLAAGLRRGRPTNYDNVSALAVYNGNLIAGGDFYEAAGTLGQWNGSQWFDSCGNGGLYIPFCMFCFPHIYAMTTYHGKLIVGGWINSVGTYYTWVNANGVAQCSDTNWSPLGNGVGVNGFVNSLTVYNNFLIAGGTFDSAGNIKTHNIAAWSDTWNMWYPLGKGINGTVNALTVYNGYLIAGGSFDSAGGMPANNIAAYDGSSWRPIGQGVNGPVNSLIAYNNYLVVGGKFTMAGGNPASNITEWLNNRWYALGAGTTNTVNAMTVYNGNLIVGGYFDTAGGIPANKIAQWTQPLGVNEVSAPEGEVRIFPNPNSGIFTIQESEVRNQNSVVEIYNMLGEKVYSTQYSHLTTQISIDLTSQSAGIYLYRLLTETGNLVSTGKFIIQK
jgi:hypothetical protein